jgi:hypothetical protein
VIGEQYSFTSSLDNALSLQTEFERCWLSNTSHRLPTVHIQSAQI